MLSRAALRRCAVIVISSCGVIAVGGGGSALVCACACMAVDPIAAARMIDCAPYQRPIPRSPLELANTIR
jgi:hypothetical protein